MTRRRPCPGKKVDTVSRLNEYEIVGNFGAFQTLNRNLNTERGVGSEISPTPPDPNNVDVDEACSRGGMRVEERERRQSDRRYQKRLFPKCGGRQRQRGFGCRVHAQGLCG